MRKRRLPWRETMRRWAASIAVLIMAVLVGLFAGIEPRPEDIHISSAEPVMVQDVGPVLADRPVVIEHSSGEFVLSAPCCALGVGGTIRLEKEEPDILSEPERAKAWYRFKVIQAEYTNPAGEVIPHAYSSTPMEACFVLSGLEWQQYQSAPENYQIQYYDDLHNPHSWQRLPAYPSDEDPAVCAQVNRLRLFALAVRYDGIPLTGGAAD
jgi:hypothetical protein